MGAQLGLDGMPRKLFTGTPTKLTTWLDCPRRYQLTYVDKVPKGPPWAHNSLGNSVHNALREWFTLPVAERTQDAAIAALDATWIREGFRDDEQSAKWQSRAARMVGNYVASVDATIEPIGVERTVAFRTDVLALSGRADRIDVRTADDGGDELVVVDYKTNRQLLSTTDVRSSLALAIYAVAAARTLRVRCNRVELHHLPSGQILTWEHDDATLQRHIARAHDIAADAQRAEELARARRATDGDDVSIEDLFPANTGPGCGFCDVVRDCPSGIYAIDAVIRPPWDVLERWPDETRSGT